MDPIVHLLHKVAAGKSNPVVLQTQAVKYFDLFMDPSWFRIIRRQLCHFCFFFMINLHTIAYL